MQVKVAIRDARETLQRQENRESVGGKLQGKGEDGLDRDAKIKNSG